MNGSYRRAGRLAVLFYAGLSAVLLAGGLVRPELQAELGWLWCTLTGCAALYLEAWLMAPALCRAGSCPAEKVREER